MRTMARTEPASEVSCLADRDTAKMCAYANHNEPFGFLDAVGVGLGVAEDVDAVDMVSLSVVRIVFWEGVCTRRLQLL